VEVGLNKLGSQRETESDPDLLLPKANVSQSHLSIWSLMLITTVCCLMAAAGNQLLKALTADNLPRSRFVMFTLLAPVMALLFMTVVRSLWRLAERLGRGGSQGPR
jgi:hypothetical protein